MISIHSKSGQIKNGHFKFYFAIPFRRESLAIPFYQIKKNLIAKFSRKKNICRIFKLSEICSNSFISVMNGE